MKYLVITAAFVLAARPSFAGATLEELLAAAQKTDVALRELDIEVLKALHAKTFQSIGEEIRELDKRKFEFELELARTNARREAVLAKIKEEDARKSVQLDMIQRKMQSVKEKRAVLEEQIGKVSTLFSNDPNPRVIPPPELTQLKLQLIDMDDQQSSLELALPRNSSHFADSLAEVEVEIAGIEAVRRTVDARGELLTPLFERAIEFEQQRIELSNKQAELARAIAEISARMESR